MKSSREEVRQLAQEIRNTYTELVNISPKFAKISLAFEDRYLATISAGGRELPFLQEEMVYVQTLLAKARYEQEAQNKVAQPTVSAVSQEVEKYNQRIASYPKFEVEDLEIEDELSHLFGALSMLEREYWVFIERFFRELYPIRAKSPMEALSNQFIRFVSAGSSNVPSALAYYADEIRRGDDKKADDMAFAVIKEVAFFLNEVIYLLNQDNFDTHHPAYIYLSGMVTDFRLSEIKRRH